MADSPVGAREGGLELLHEEGLFFASDLMKDLPPARGNVSQGVSHLCVTRGGPPSSRA